MVDKLVPALAILLFISLYLLFAQNSIFNVYYFILSS